MTLGMSTFQQGIRKIRGHLSTGWEGVGGAGHDRTMAGKVNNSSGNLGGEGLTVMSVTSRGVASGLTPGRHP